MIEPNSAAIISTIMILVLNLLIPYTIDFIFNFSSSVTILAFFFMSLFNNRILPRLRPLSLTLGFAITWGYFYTFEWFDMDDTEDEEEDDRTDGVNNLERMVEMELETLDYISEGMDSFLDLFFYS
jgi:hypothetical protein